MTTVINGLKTGTLKDWSVRRPKYWGVLRRGSVIEWTCEHSHRTSGEALTCATEEIRR